MKLPRCVVLAGLIGLAGCEAFSDAPEESHQGGTAGFGVVPGVSAGRGSMQPVPPRAGSGATTGGEGMPMMPPCGPFGCGMCFECSPGCSDCGMGCMCFDAGAPVPLPWDPPFENVGDVGYQGSTEPFCSGMMQVVSLDVWSDARGVFALLSGIGSQPMGAEIDEDDAGVPSPPEDSAANPGGFTGRSEVQPRTELWWNDGRSWKPSLDELNRLGRYELTGAPGSALIIHGEPVAETSELGMLPRFPLCALGTIDGGGIDCMDLDPVTSVFVVGKERAAAILNASRLLLHDGERWRGDTAPIPFPVTEVWASDGEVLAAGRAGIVLWREGDGWRLEDPGTLAHITALWGTSRQDVWAGTSDGHVLHYDGTVWNEVAALGGASCDSALPIEGIWGAGGDVFVHSRTQLARIRGGEVESLANWSCSLTADPQGIAITGLWGNGPNEVFIAITDHVRPDSDRCGAAHVVYYDGESFHRM